VSAVRKILRGPDVIVWIEQKPDFFHRSCEELFVRLPFTAVCSVVLDAGSLPLVVADRTTLDGVWSHLAERPVEMGGLLIGSVHDLPGLDPRFAIAVTDHVRSVEYHSTSVSLTMDTDVWDRARARAGDGRCVVGWYHSHPDLGVFFSGTDRRTQRAFFNNPHSLGLVIDPIRHEEKWFIGAGSDDVDPRQIVRYRSTPKLVEAPG
jgi:proteasome lid subunit RPN8/RPN11